MISKELLSEVLEEKIIEIKPIQPTKRLLYFRVMRGKYEQIFNADINIYELAHKCKEWAATQGYMIEIKYFIDKIYVSCNIDGEGFLSIDGAFIKSYDNNDINHLFEYCEWILEQQI